MSKQVNDEMKIIDPEIIPTQQPKDLVKRGWVYYSNGDYPKAENDFQNALINDPQVDTYYALGLTFRAENKSEKSVEMFETVLNLLKSGDDITRSNMLTRLARGQINFVKTKDWNLEKEIWHKKYE